MRMDVRTSERGGCSRFVLCSVRDIPITYRKLHTTQRTPHDALDDASLIYNPKSGTNEEDSAERFKAFAEEAKAWLVRTSISNQHG